MALDTLNSGLVAVPAAAGQPLIRVRAVAPFRLPSAAADPQPGDELELPRSLAMELVMYRKVEVLPPAMAEEPAEPSKKARAK